MNLLKLFLYLMPFFYVTCTYLMLPKQKNTQFLQKCVDHIQNIYVKPTDFVIFLNINVLFHDLKVNLKTVVIQPTYGKKLLSFSLLKADVYFITISTKLTKHVFEFLPKTSEWNPRAKFVIILEGSIEGLFSILQTHYVYNVIVLRLKSETETEIFTYFPYDLSVPEGERTREVMLDLCLQGELKTNANLFPEKLPDFWTNTTVRVALIKYPPYVMLTNCEDKMMCGVEPDIFQAIQTILGFKIDYVQTSYEDWGHKLENGSYVGGSKGLQNREFDVGIGAYFPNSSESWDFDLSHSHLEDSLNWVVPASTLQPRWKTDLKSFKPHMWISMLVCFVLSSLVLYFVAFPSPELKRYRSISSCLVICFQCLNGQGIYALPKTSPARIIFVTWVFFSYIMATSFQSKATESLNFNIYEKQISSVEELIESNLQFGFYPDSSFQFSNTDNKIDSYIYNNFIPCSRSSGCTKRVAFKRDFATVKMKRYLSFMIVTGLLDSNRRPLVYIIKNKVRVVLLTMAFAKGFPIFEQVNKLLLKFKDAGFIARFYDMISNVEKKKRTEGVKIIVGALALKEYEGSFYILIIGWAGACIAFVVEYYKMAFINCLKVKSKKALIGIKEHVMSKYRNRK